jgi:TetR/AcrR family transcriptional regulator
MKSIAAALPLPDSPAPAVVPRIASARMSGKDRRRQIIQAAIEVFAKHGFRGTTTKQIAEAAGVSEAIIFRHFATKQDLYAAILDLKAAESGRDEWIEEAKTLAAAGDDEKLLGGLIRRILESYRRDPVFHRLMTYAALEGHEFSAMLHGQRSHFHKCLRDYVAGRQKAGALRKLDPDLLVFALIAMPSFTGLVTGVFGVPWLEVPVEEAARAFTQILMDGVRKPSGPPPNGKYKPKRNETPFIPVRSQKPDVHIPNR